MRYNNRLYPHPVLGIEDDIKGEFLTELQYKSDKQNIYLTPSFRLTEINLSNCILKAQALFIIHVYCRATMYREVFSSSQLIGTEIIIPANKLKGDVEADFFICAMKEIQKYSSANFNAEYGNSNFEIDRSDILAYGGKAKFVANKSPEELKSISSLIRIKNSGESLKPMYNEYESEKIEITLCQEDYDRYQLSVRNKEWHSIIHSGVVLPALIDALYFIEKDEAEAYSSRRWYRALNEIKTKSKIQDCFQIAQNILDKPLDRTFETLLREME